MRHTEDIADRKPSTIVACEDRLEWKRRIDEPAENTRELTRFHGHRYHIAAHRARMIGKIFFQEFRTIVHNDISADDRGSRGDEIGKVLWYVEAQKNKDREQ